MSRADPSAACFKAMPNRQYAVVWLCGLLFFTGCAAVAPLETTLISPNSPLANDQPLTLTWVRLSENNFQLIKTNVVGESWGFKLFSLFTIVPATKVKAFARMYRAAQLPMNTPTAPVHLLVEQTESGFLLFSIPETYVRADFVMFTPQPTPEENRTNSETEPSPEPCTGITNIPTP